MTGLTGLTGSGLSCYRVAKQVATFMSGAGVRVEGEIMRRVVLRLMGSLVVVGLFGCGRPEAPQEAPRVTVAEFRADDALPEEGFAPGWKVIPGSYIYAGSEDELWKIYDGAAPGVIRDGGREAATQGYENTEGGADKSFRVFILRFVDKPHALDYLETDIEGAEGGEKLDAVDAGWMFDKGKTPWARFVVAHHLVSINWEGSDDDTDNAAKEVVSVMASGLRSE